MVETLRVASPEKARRATIHRFSKLLRTRWRVALPSASLVLAVGAAGGDYAFHHFWPFQHIRDEIQRIGPPLPGATLVGETTSGFPYGCLDECPSVTATWHVSPSVALEVAERIVTSRLLSHGYRPASTSGVQCWATRSPNSGATSVRCNLYFMGHGHSYGVGFNLPASVTLTPPPQDQEVRVSVPGSARVGSLDTSVGG